MRSKLFTCYPTFNILTLFGKSFLFKLIWFHHQTTTMWSSLASSALWYVSGLTNCCHQIFFNEGKQVLYSWFLLMIEIVCLLPSYLKNDGAAIAFLHFVYMFYKPLTLKIVEEFEASQMIWPYRLPDLSVHTLSPNPILGCRDLFQCVDYKFK